MVRYLLGDLPEAEQAALEERCFSDSDTFDRMWETENRLVDGYVRGTLAAEDRNRFEAYYLASPVHRTRVSAARHLISAANTQHSALSTQHSAPSTAQTSSESFWQRFRRTWQLSPALQAAMAAGLLLLALGVAWLIVERTQLRSELANLRTENAARQNREQEFARQIESRQSEHDRLTAELERLKQQQSPLPPSAPLPSQPGASKPRPSRPPSIFSFVLLPVSMRGNAGHVMTVPPDADQVQLQLTIPQDDWASYQAEIKTVEGAPVWSQRQLKARAGNVSVNVPASRLKFNDYILTLSGVNRTGEIEVVNRYSFRAIR